MSPPELSAFRHDLNNRLAKLISQAEAVMDHTPPHGAASRAADTLIVMVEETAAFVRRTLDRCS